MIQLPNLEVHDAPDGVVLPEAFSIQWLQTIIDFWYHMLPFSATVTHSTFNWTANSETMVLPEDFILDVRHGWCVQTVPGNVKSVKRVRRIPFAKFLPWSIQHSNSASSNILYPYFYCIIERSGNQQLMRITPVPTVNVVGTLWYYALPPVLQANDRPIVPNDQVCITYLRIAALEWAGLAQPGTAETFCNKLMAGYKSAGLLNEPEDDIIGLDDLTFRGSTDMYENPYAWIGPV